MTLFQRFFVRSYRVLAVAVLATVLLTAASYFITIILYSVNQRWVAPLILTGASPRVMATGAEAFRARQGLATLHVARDALEREIAVVADQSGVLRELLSRYELALSEETKASTAFAGHLSQLRVVKQRDDRRADVISVATGEIENSIEQELASGLITREGAARARAQIVSLQASVTSGKMGSVALNQQINELQGDIDTMHGEAKSTKALESISRIAALKQQLAELSITDFKNRADLKNKRHEIRELEAIVHTVEATPYFRIARNANAASQFAFVPYENEKSVKLGADVYSCWAKVVLCSRVGKVAWIGHDEEKGFHPIFQRDIRGFLIQLELNKPSAAKDTVLFLGSAPLMI